MSVPILLGALLLVGGVVLFVLEPILRNRKAPLTREDAEPTETEARKRVALLALRDVEYDYATGKLDDEDYADLRNQLAREALEAMGAEEADEREAGPDEPRDADLGGYPAARTLDELEQEIAAYRAALRKGSVCPACGQLNEAEARFCAQCGTPLGDGPRDEPSTPDRQDGPKDEAALGA